MRERNTGRGSGLEGYVELRLRHERQAADTRRYADILDRAGLKGHLEVKITNFGAVTGFHGGRAEHEGFRNTNVLPVVASRNRAAMLRELNYFLDEHPKGGLMRYGVVTFGERIELYDGDLRRAVQAAQRRISKWAAWVRKKFGIVLCLRIGELTVDEALSIHPHANIVYYLDRVRPLSAAEWDRFLTESRATFGAHWKDCGRIQSAAEVVKYFFKGDDLALLADMACAVPEWSDGGFDVEHLAAAVAPRLAAKEGRETGRTVRAGSMMPAALSTVLALAKRLRAAYEAGASHPLVWLFQEMFGLHVAMPSGEFRRYRAGLRAARERVVSTWSDNGGRVLRRVRREEGRRRRSFDPAEMSGKVRQVLLEGMPDQSLEEAIAAYVSINGDLRRNGTANNYQLVIENRILAVTLPQSRFSAWAEPTVMVEGFTLEPKTEAGRRGLRRLRELQEQASKDWRANGAPDPIEAMTQSRKAYREAAGEPRPQPCEDRGSSVDTPYGSHLYDNCPEEERAVLPFCLADGSLVDRSTGEVVLEPPSRPPPEENHDIFDPRTWWGEGKNWRGSGQRYWMRWHYDPLTDGCSDK